MQLDQQFTIPVGVDEAWAAMLDIRRVARAFPGATLIEADRSTFTGTVKVKLGPVQLHYRGEARFTEVDEKRHRIEMAAGGTDMKGNGNATADIIAELAATPEGGTLCTLSTKLEISGRAAQFGRGIVVDIGNRVIGQFARNLADGLTPDPEPETSPPPRTGASDSSVGSSADGVALVRPTAPPASSTDGLAAGDALDLFALVGDTRAGRLVGAGIAATAALAIVTWLVARMTRTAR